MFEIIQDELNRLESHINEAFLQAEFPEMEILQDFMLKNSKRMRSTLIILILKMLDMPISEEQIRLMTALEFLHSATLLHDDILDCEKTRRNLPTICGKYDDKVATLTGDLLLSVSLSELSKLNNPYIVEIFSKSVLKTCKGELSQQLQRGNIPTLEEYLKKSENKTGVLFYCGVKSALYLEQNLVKDFCEIICHGACKKVCANMATFALKFGTAFQILNDLSSKNDVKSDIFTLPYVLCAKDGGNCNNIDKKYFNEAQCFLHNFVKEMNMPLNNWQNTYSEKLKSIIYDLEAK